jgi:hypothetical protein
MSVVSVAKLRIRLSETAGLINKALEAMQAESENLPGFLAGEILVSLDGKIVVFISEWVDIHAWSRSRYGDKVGKVLADSLAVSTEIEFEIYDRRAKFLATEKKSDIDRQKS